MIKRNMCRVIDESDFESREMCRIVNESEESLTSYGEKQREEKEPDRKEKYEHTVRYMHGGRRYIPKTSDGKFVMAHRAGATLPDEISLVPEDKDVIGKTQRAVEKMNQIVRGKKKGQDVIFQVDQGGNLLADGERILNGYITSVVKIRESTGDKLKVELKLANGISVTKILSGKEFRKSSWLEEMVDAVIYIDKISFEKLYRIYIGSFIENTNKEVFREEYGGWIEVESGRFAYATSDFTLGSNQKIEIKNSLVLNPLEIGEDESVKFFFDALDITHSIIAGFVMLYALSSRLYTLFKKAGCPLQFCCFIKGRSGSFKTTISKLLALSCNEQDRILDFKSTKAGLERQMSKAKDCVFVVDDFNPSLDRKVQLAMETALEGLVRAVGNGKARTINTDFAKNTEIEPYEVRGGCLFTGEYDAGTSSSFARMIVLQLERDDVNVEVLTELQKRHREWDTFLCHFLGYVSSIGNVCCVIGDMFDEFRNQYKSLFKNAPRSADYMADLMVVVQLLCNYLLEKQLCDVTFVKSFYAQISHELLQVVSTNAASIINLSEDVVLAKVLKFIVEGELFSDICYYSEEEQILYITQKEMAERYNLYLIENNISLIKTTEVKIARLLHKFGYVEAHKEGKSVRYSERIYVGKNEKSPRLMRVNTKRLFEN